MKMYFLIALMILSTCFLSGCQLAKETMAANHKTDNLCGLFVTIGNDDGNSFVDSEVKVNSKGELEFSTTPSDHTIEGIMKDGRVTFGDIPGYYMGLVEVDLNNSMNNCYGSDKGFNDVKVALNSKDGIEDHRYEATITISRKTQKRIDINPVYVRADGNIYTVLGQNVGYMNYGTSSGQIYSQTLSDEKSITQGGIVKTEKKAFTVTLVIADEAKKVLIKEMNQEDGLIKTTLYSQGNTDDFIVSLNTSYVIVEEMMTDNDNKEYINRSVYSLENKNLDEEYVSHTCKFPGEGGVIGTKTIRFIRKN
jgi:hypothetical protein